MAMQRVRNRLEALSKQGITIDTLVESKIWNYESFRALYYLKFNQCHFEQLKIIMAWITVSFVYDQFNAPLELLALMACHLREPRKDVLIFRDAASDQSAPGASLQDTLNTIVFKETESLNRKLITFLMSSNPRFDVENSMLESILKLITINKKDIFSTPDTPMALKTKMTKYEEDAKLEDEYEICISNKLLQPEYIAYLGMLSLCSFRCVLKSPAVVLKSLDRTFSEKLKLLYLDEFREIDMNITLPSEECLNSYKLSMQEGSTGTKSIVGHCLHHTLSKNCSTSTIGILRYGLLTHTSMAGLQLISMLLLATDTLKFDDPIKLIKMLGCRESMRSINRVIEYLEMYFTGYNGLNEIEIQNKRAIKSTFKWAKLLDQSYYADLSIKNNLYFGFMLASLNSKSINEGQTKMAVFDSPSLPKELKERIFIDMRLLCKAVFNEIDESQNFMEYNKIIHDIRSRKVFINEDGEVEEEILKDENKSNKKIFNTLRTIKTSSLLPKIIPQRVEVKTSDAVENLIEEFDNLSFDKLNS